MCLCFGLEIQFLGIYHKEIIEMVHKNLNHQKAGCSFNNSFNIGSV